MHSVQQLQSQQPQVALSAQSSSIPQQQQQQQQHALQTQHYSNGQQFNNPPHR
jgi:hypothetical protein